MEDVLEGEEEEQQRVQLPKSPTSWQRMSEDKKEEFVVSTVHFYVPLRSLRFLRFLRLCLLRFCFSAHCLIGSRKLRGGGGVQQEELRGGP